MQRELILNGVHVQRGLDERLRLEIENRYKVISKEVFGNESLTPPDKISLVSGIIVLLSLGWDRVAVSEVKKLKAPLDVRNSLWLEHGFSLGTKEQEESLYRETRSIVSKIIGDRNFGILKSDANSYWRMLASL